MGEEFIKVGEIGVDAGLVWIGDPCYILHKKKNDVPKSIGKDWLDFCNKLNDEKGKPLNHKQFNYDRGHAGLGVCVSSGFGDGVYDVMAKIEEGRIKEIKVKFF